MVSREHAISDRRKTAIFQTAAKEGVVVRGENAVLDGERAVTQDRAARDDTACDENREFFTWSVPLLTM